MAHKSKIEIIAKCEKCGFEPFGEKQGNWNVISTTCPKCGGKISPKVLEMK